MIAATVREDYYARQVLAAVCLAEIEPSGATVELERSALGKDLQGDLVRLLHAREMALPMLDNEHRKILKRLGLQVQPTPMALANEPGLHNER